MNTWLLVLLILNPYASSADNHSPGWHQTETYRFESEAHCKAAADKMYRADHILDALCLEIKP